MTDPTKIESTASPAATGTPLEAVEAIYANMQDKLNDMLAACKTKAERADILEKFVAARHNYDDCVNQQFHGNDPVLATLVDKANKSAAEIRTINVHLGNIAKVINIVTTAVDYGSQIVKKIISV